MRQMLMRHSMDPVPSARATRSEVPEHVSWALVRAMAKEPNERFASAAEFSRALSRNSAMIALRRTESLWSRVRTVFTFRSAPKPAPHSAPAQSPRASTLTSNQASAPVATEPARSPMGIPTPIVTTPSGRLPLDSLAVLPFTNVSGDADSEYLGEGISESIMNKLSGVTGLRVVPRSVVFRYKGHREPCEVGREVHARAVVTGRILQRGDTLVIKAELVDSQTESQLWGDQYNRKMDDIFAVQEEMAAEITRSLRLKLSGEEAAGLAKRFTESTKAYQAYLRGRHHWNKRTV
jgi:TolB-like protein